MPLGLTNALELGEEEIQLNTGDRLFLYTDGITECKDPHRHVFGQERLEDFISSNTSSSPETFTESLLSQLRVFRQGDKFNDDLCLIVFDVL